MSEHIRVNPAAVDIKKFAADIDFNAYQLQRAKRDDSQLNKVVRPSLTYWQDAWYKLRHNPVATVGLCLLIIYVFLAIFAPILSQYDFGQQNAAAKNMKPCAEHLFGTDAAGRDLWVRNWMGARVSLTIGLVVVLINTAIGIIVGGVSGYFGGKVDMIIMRVIDVLYGIPTIILAILLMVVMGAGISSLIVAMVCVGWISSARLVRGQVLQLKNMEYVMAARTLGASDRRIIFRHMIPNISGIIITNMTMAIPNAIFTEAFLSYIGIGVQAPKCSWGSLAQAASMVYKLYPYQLIIPAFFICTTMLSLNMLGDGLRDALDPKMH
ncbi:MAG: ABC transporter permease [Firmicutes bacterium]|nr:ABC transporter permease [Bacillota bacterium]